MESFQEELSLNDYFVKYYNAVGYSFGSAIVLFIVSAIIIHFVQNDSFSIGKTNRTVDKCTPSFFSSNTHQDHVNQDGNSRRKIDPKYFKPKFIIHELVIFWDTTCAVITWGSFYVIGGTIVATEKISQRIKAKSPHHYQRGSSSIFGDNNRNSNRGTGCQSGFSFSSAFGSPSQTNNNSNTPLTEPRPSRQPFKRISSWTKRSINSIKKKYSRAVRSNAPQLTSGNANESGASFFFANNSF